MNRVLGLDVGEKTIGTALSDPLGVTAQGIKTINRKDIESDLKELQDLITENEVATVVVGLPRNMNGTYGPSAEMAREFSEQIKESLNVNVVFWDERLSTVSAERALIDADMSRKKRKKVVDKVAAVIILQNYLDSKI